jgi:hypothetical protein
LAGSLEGGLGLNISPLGLKGESIIKSKKQVIPSGSYKVN